MRNAAFEAELEVSKKKGEISDRREGSMQCGAILESRKVK